MFAVICLCSCSDKAVKNFSLTFIVTEKIGNDKNEKYPDFYAKMCTPITTGKNIEYNYVPGAILVKRLDIENCTVKLSIVADEKKSNVSNLNYRRNMVTKFFDENTIGYQLCLESGSRYEKKESILSYVSSLGKKNRVFYYSANPLNDMCNGEIIYDNIDTLRNAIANYLFSNSATNVFVIVNPESGKEQITKTIEDTSTHKKDTTSQSGEVKHSNTFDNPAKHIVKEIRKSNSDRQIDANNIEEYFAKIADKTIPYNMKFGLKTGIQKYFTSPRAVVIKQINGSEVGRDNIKDYVEGLSNTHRGIKIVRKKYYSDKINIIYIEENSGF